MKRFKLTACVVLLFLTALALSGCDNSTPKSQVAKGASVDNVAPDFTLTDMHGEQVTLSQFKGKVVILNFWATWCPPCKEEMPSMERLYREFSDKGLVMLAVNVDDNGRSAVAQFLQRTPYSFPILIDDKNVAQNVYGVFRFPESFIIDRHGEIVEKIIGGRNWLSGKTFDLINFLVNG